MKSLAVVYLSLSLCTLGACSGDGVTDDGGNGAPDLSGIDAGPIDLGPSIPDSSGGPSLAYLNEEFDDASVLQRLNDLDPALHDSLTVGTDPGRLVMTPVQVTHTHWFSDSHGPFLYKTVSGDFVVEIDVSVGRRDDPGQAPRGSYSAGGILVRDPQSARSAERWLMYNMGHQTATNAREAKTTRPGGGASLSTLYLVPTPGGVTTGRLRVCRVGGTFRFFHRHLGESEWVEEAYGQGTAPMGNGAGEATPGVVVGGVIRFERPDMPDALQVGLMAGHWEGTLEVRASYDYLRYGVATGAADCTGPLR